MHECESVKGSGKVRGKDGVENDENVDSERGGEVDAM